MNRHTYVLEGPGIDDSLARESCERRMRNDTTAHANPPSATSAASAIPSQLRLSRLNAALHGMVLQGSRQLRQANRESVTTAAVANANVR